MKSAEEKIYNMCKMLNETDCRQCGNQRIRCFCGNECRSSCHMLVAKYHKLIRGKDISFLNRKFNYTY